MKAVDVRPGPQFSFSVQKSLFPIDRFSLDQSHWFYGVAPNDSRFLLYGSLVAQEGAELILVQNWKQSLGKQ